MAIGQIARKLAAVHEDLAITTARADMRGIKPMAIDTTYARAPDATRLTGRTAAYRWYVLALLFLANCFNAMDRSILSIVIEPVKRELLLNDTEIGIITGLGYALVYAGIGIAIARLVDRGNRKNLLAGGIAFWSAMTVLSGYTAGFWSMLGARFGVAAGEATCYPNALSLIGDYFERSKRSRAIAVFQLGTYGGIIFGIAIAGVLAAKYGWRSSFHILGLPGLALALLMALTLREPPRGMSDGQAQGDGGPTESGVKAMVGLLRGDSAFAWLVGASVIMTIAQVTMGTWMPAFMMRIHGLGPREVGLMAAPVIGGAGIVGTLIGGLAGTRIAQRNPAERAPLQVMLVTAPLAVPSLLLFLFSPTFTGALIGGALGAFFIAMHFGPMVAVILGLVDPRARGAATSLLVSAQFLIGLGLGPLIVGAISDLLQPTLGQDSLRYAMLLPPITVTLAWALTTVGYRHLAGRAAAG